MKSIFTYIFAIISIATFIYGSQETSNNYAVSRSCTGIQYQQKFSPLAYKVLNQHLLLSIHINDVKEVKFALQRGANVNFHDCFGYNALDIAQNRSKPNQQIIKLLDAYKTIPEENLSDEQILHIIGLEDLKTQNHNLNTMQAFQNSGNNNRQDSRLAAWLNEK